jgi:hypothetical protein
MYGSVSGTLVAGAFGWAANTVAVAGALEGGIVLGSALNAAAQTGLNRLLNCD